MNKIILLFCLFFFSVLSFNSYGQSESLLDSTVSWEWNSDSSDWFSNWRNHYTYYQNDNPATETSFSRYSSEWDTLSRITKTYDSNNNLLSFTGQSWNGTEWASSMQLLYTYDVNNNKITELRQMWNNGWVNDYHGVYTYDINSNKTAVFLQTWLNNMWSDDNYLNYTYDANNNLLNSVDKWWVNNAWVYGDSSAYTYDVNNNQTSSLAYGRQGNTWFGSLRLSYTYDNNNNLTTELIESWNTDTQMWVNGSYTIYTYDGNNNRTNILNKNWDGSNWVNNTIEDRTYYANDSIAIIHSCNHWNNNTWNVCFTRSYTYNWDNNVQSSLGSLYQNQIYRKIDSTYYYYYGLTGIYNIENKRDFKIYPNPAYSIITIETALSNGTYQFSDITGKTLLQGSVTSTKFTLNLSTLSSGVYFISVSDGDKQVFGKVVKE